MKTQLEVNGIRKHTEKDSYENGCDPDTSKSIYIEQTFKADTQEELIVTLHNLLDIPMKAGSYDINPCEDGLNRIDFYAQENLRGKTPNEMELKLWRADHLELYSSIYSVYVDLVMRAPFTLSK